MSNRLTAEEYNFTWGLVWANIMAILLLGGVAWLLATSEQDKRIELEAELGLKQQAIETLYLLLLPEMPKVTTWEMKMGVPAGAVIDSIYILSSDGITLEGG